MFRGGLWGGRIEKMGLMEDKSCKEGHPPLGRTLVIYEWALIKICI